MEQQHLALDTLANTEISADLLDQRSFDTEAVLLC
jgi:hypothetical protein